MITTNNRIRFCENNFARLISASIDFSSELAAFPFTNCINPFRSRSWKPSGCFIITAGSNDKIYINDGSNKTITLTAGEYDTPTLLASHIQTKLNASSTNWVVAYNTLSGDYSFKITHTGSATLRLTQTTEAVWDTIGFTTLSDLVGTSFLADQQRNHTEEYAVFDLGYNASISFFAMIGSLDEVFTISNNATITLMGSNLNQWNAPPYTTSIPISDKGAMKFLNDEDTAYRFWKVIIQDKQNPEGPEGISIGVLYLGDYVTLDNTNYSIGFDNSDVDPSSVAISESGVLHYDAKTKYSAISGGGVDVLFRSDKDRLKAMFEYLGLTTPFFVSIDPLLLTTSTIEELTKYVVFASEPKFTHIINDLYSVSLDFREVI